MPRSPASRRLVTTIVAFGLYVLFALGCGITTPQSWRSSLGPVVPHDTFPADCGLCHKGGDWHQLREDFQFDHEKSTGFALVGAHAAAQCLRCHNDRGPVQAFAARGCVGCHEDVHQGKLGKECKSCHDETDWVPNGQIQKHAATRFPLVGSHAAVACFRCHPGAQVGNFQRADVRCESCHARDLARATSPDHAGRGWTSSCERCHLPTAWQDARFDHSTWPLLGAHAGATCTQCHVNGVYAGTSQACASCHQRDYDSTTNPRHANAGFSTQCQTCHSPNGWTGANFVHSAFALTGRHTAAACNTCHQNGVYAGTPRDCSGCHLAKYTATTSPSHVAAGFPTACQNCHTTSGWTGANFTHGTWPLTGRHTSTSCSTCHPSGVYAGTSRDCSGCHLAKYTATTKPAHAAAGFPTACQNCHNTSGWTGANFTHSTWPLTGRHTSTACASCHGNGVYAGTPRDCSGCHLAKYNATTNPRHSAAGFATTCQTCHTTTGWTGANFNHSIWARTGAHASAACTACHGTGVYAGTPRDCSGCHLAKYNATTNPNHRTAGFPTTCQTCHKSTTTWAGATFTHRFPITSGAHAGTACTQCHQNASSYAVFTCTTCHEHAQTTMNSKHRNVNGYSWTSTACYQCHPNGRH